MKKSILIIMIILGISQIGTASAQDNIQSLQLNMDKCVKIALEKNNDIKIAEQNIKENTAKIRQTESALYPQINFTPSYIRTEPINRIIINNNSVEIGKINNYDINLNLKQLIYTFGRLENSIKASKLNVESSKLDKEKTDQQIILNVKEAYYNVLRVQEFLQIAYDSVQSNKKHLKVAQDFFKNGAAAKYDVLRTETKLSEAQTNYIKANNSVDINKNVLKSIININLNTPINIEKDADINYISKLNDENEYIKNALIYRPEAKQTIVTIDMAKKLVNVARLSNNPNLNLVYNYDWKNPTNFSLAQSWNLTAALSVPIFDGMNAHYKTNEANENLIKMQVLADQIKSNITLEVKQAYLNFNETKSRLDTVSFAVSEAKEALSIAEVRYESGISIITELSDSQLAYDVARFNYSNALYDYKIAVAKLEKAVGGKQYFEKLITR